VTRTIITIETDDKIWLEQKARQSKESMAELIRRAIGEMRKREESSFQGLLNQTAGIWKHGDGLQYQQDIRGEWDR
jgi:hypothetical protein